MCWRSSRNKMKRSLFITAIAALVLLLPFGYAQAAEVKCELGKVKELPEAKGKTDLELRRELLGNTLQCANEEATHLRDTLKALEVKDQEVSATKDKFIDFLNQAVEYYDTEKGKVAAADIAGNKDLAKQIMDFRNNNYQPVAKEAGNMVVWQKNQVVIQTSRNRLDQLREAARIYKIDSEESIKKLLDEAQRNQEKAEDMNWKARQGLITSTPPEVTVVFIKDSLSALGDAYQNFFDLSNEIKDLVPMAR